MKTFTLLGALSPYVSTINQSHTKNKNDENENKCNNNNNEATSTSGAPKRNDLESSSSTSWLVTASDKIKAPFKADGGGARRSARDAQRAQHLQKLIKSSEVFEVKFH